MCRLAAFPPNFPRLEAIEILKDFEKDNTDGTGSVFLRDKQFVVHKWAQPLSRVLKTKSFLSHMPHDGWTVAHLRAASHGGNTRENTHPFVAGRWAVVHNGIWSDYSLVKLALGRSIKLEGETDSEVAAHLINIAGPKKFAEEVSWGGVFLALNKDGSLWAIKASGILAGVTFDDDSVLLASEFCGKYFKNSKEADCGWYHFDKNGYHVKHKVTRPAFNCVNLYAGDGDDAGIGIDGKDGDVSGYYCDVNSGRIKPYSYYTD